MWRARLRLTSALVMLAFVICHLTAHWFLLVSVDKAEPVLTVLMYPWRTRAGTAILVTAFVVHYCNALWSIYIRRSLRLNRWELTQLGLGLCIPILLMFHVVGTRIAESTLGVDAYYNTVLVGQWLHRPWLAAVQMIALLAVWVHACIGIHYWLRTELAARIIYLWAVAADISAGRLYQRRQSSFARSRRRSGFCKNGGRGFARHAASSTGG
jgi:adenylate cyclase